MGSRSIAIAALVVLSITATASAQTARAIGTVRDVEGKPIKGATIRATNPDAYPPQVISTSDDKGRWAMIGLKIGSYSFTIEAPGYAAVKASANVRTAPAPPMVVTMARDPGPIPGALPPNIQAQLAAANMLRDQGRLEQAIGVYQEIRAKNPKLTSVNLVIGQMYRQRAGQEADRSARRALLDRAIQSYSDALAADDTNVRARRELEAVRAEATLLQ